SWTCPGNPPAVILANVRGVVAELGVPSVADFIAATLTSRETVVATARKQPVEVGDELQRLGGENLLEPGVHGPHDLDAVSCGGFGCGFLGQCERCHRIFPMRSYRERGVIPETGLPRWNRRARASKLRDSVR